MAQVGLYDGQWCVDRSSFLSIFVRVTDAFIGCWAAYTAIRYFIAFSLHKTPDQQTISLALGIVSALSLASLVLSGGVEAYTARFVRSTKSSPIFPKLHILLEYTASASLMSPAITNLVLTCIWRHSADPLTVVGGRCLWDIDVLWSITGRACEPSRTISWGYWLTGAIIRLAITAAILVCAACFLCALPADHRAASLRIISCRLNTTCCLHVPLKGRVLGRIPIPYHIPQISSGTAPCRCGV